MSATPATQAAARPARHARAVAQDECPGRIAAAEAGASHASLAPPPLLLEPLEPRVLLSVGLLEFHMSAALLDAFTFGVHASPVGRPSATAAGRGELSASPPDEETSAAMMAGIDSDDGFGDVSLMSSGTLSLSTGSGPFYVASNRSTRLLQYRRDAVAGEIKLVPSLLAPSTINFGLEAVWRYDEASDSWSRIFLTETTRRADVSFNINNRPRSMRLWGRDCRPGCILSSLSLMAGPTSH